MRTLILNSSNIVEGTNNSILQYNFVGGGISLNKGQKIALANLQMYYSTFNITALNQNNSFSYTWVDGINYPVNIPNGFYSVNALNNFLHFTMVQNFHYLESTTGDFVYFITLDINPVQYGVEVNTFGMSVALAASNSWVLPVGATWVIPTNFIIPSLVVLNNNFGLVIGFNTGSYPNAVIAGVPPAQTQTPAFTTDQQFLSSFTPQVSPVASFILTCSLVNNNYAVPNNLVYSFAPEGNIGEQFSVAPNEYILVDVLPAYYNSFQVSFLDQNFRPVAIEDPNMLIQFVITDGDESVGHLR